MNTHDPKTLIGDLKLPVSSNDDKTLECLACGQASCEWRVFLQGAGRQVHFGAHERCIKRNAQFAQHNVKGDGYCPACNMGTCRWR